MSRSTGKLEVNMVELRGYLRDGSPEDGQQLLRDAFTGRFPGALELVTFCLQLRGNPQTRRSVTEVSNQWNLCRRGAAEPGWYGTLLSHLIGMFRQWRKYGFPHHSSHRTSSAALTQRLPRRDRRQVGYTGSVRVELPSLASQAQAACRSLWEDMRGQQLVLWVDNWYCERYGVDPANPVASTDLSAAAVLILSSADDRPAHRTRSHQLPPFRGHVDLLFLFNRVGSVASDLVQSLGSLVGLVNRLNLQAVQRTDIRVPLDIQRPARRSLQWRTAMLTESRVSSNTELFALLCDVQDLRHHSGCVLPLLVDEKVYYAITRMMLSKSFGPWQVWQWMGRMPLLYGTCPGNNVMTKPVR